MHNESHPQNGVRIIKQYFKYTHKHIQLLTILH